MKFKEIIARLFGKKTPVRTNEQSADSFLFKEMPPPEETIAVVPKDVFDKIASYEDIAAVEEAGRKATAKWNELHRKPKNDVPLAKDILGDQAPEGLVWEDKDDLMVDFTIVPALVAGDPEFLIDYMLGVNGTNVDYQTWYRPCSIEPEELHTLAFVADMLEMQEGHFCYMVRLEKIYGLLMINPSDAASVIHRTSGVEIEVRKELYRLQFMRFDPKAIEKADIAEEPLDATNSITVSVNFADFEEPVPEPLNGSDVYDAIKTSIEKNGVNEANHIDSISKL